MPEPAPARAKGPPRPPDFPLTQSKLQDWADCPRRFELQHLQGLAWPALQTSPAREHERQLKLGTGFHRLVHQHQAGIPAESLARLAADPELARWWQSYLDHFPPGLPARRWPELTLTAALSGRRLVAKYDLLAAEPGERLVIVDWKTGRQKPPRTWLEGRWQTRVYRFLLVEAGGHLNGDRPVAPEQVELVYWFANHPRHPERFPYDARQHEADRERLEAALAALSHAGEFGKADDARHCRFCRYRSYCERGVEAGSLAEAGSELEWELELEQVEELEL